MVYGIIALLALLVDQFLKFWTVSNVALNTGIRPLIPGFLHITYIKNFGAAFGVMSSFGALRWILLILLIAFTALMVFAFIKGYFRTGLTKVSGALLLAGLLGNGIDRAIYGYVPDIFELELFKFPIFNLADVLVLIGGILFAVAILTGGLRRADEFDDYEEEEAPVRPARRREYDDEPAARRAPRTAEEAPVRRTAPRPAAPATAAPSARGTAAPSPARQRAAGNGFQLQVVLHRSGNGEQFAGLDFEKLRRFGAGQFDRFLFQPGDGKLNHCRRAFPQVWLRSPRPPPPARTAGSCLSARRPP